jgi:uncharacterized coiled-coil DUF342 family protein
MREMAIENAHLKSEIKRLQNSMDKLRMDMSSANDRSDNWREESDELKRELAEAREENERLRAALKFCANSDNSPMICAITAKQALGEGDE